MKGKNIMSDIHICDIDDFGDNEPATEFEHVFYDDSQWSTMKIKDKIEYIAEALADLLKHEK